MNIVGINVKKIAQYPDVSCVQASSTYEQWSIASLFRYECKCGNFDCITDEQWKRIRHGRKTFNFGKWIEWFESCFEFIETKNKVARITVAGMEISWHSNTVTSKESQDLVKIEKWFWAEGMIRGYCWTLMHETDPKQYIQFNRSSFLIYHFLLNKIAINCQN